MILSKVIITAAVPAIEGHMLECPLLTHTKDDNR